MILNPDNIKKEIELIQNYINEDKIEVLNRRINERLDKSLSEYYNKVSKALDKLSIYNNNNDLNLIKKLNKGE